MPGAVNDMGVPKPGAIVFDLDGTLVDSVPDLAGSLDLFMAERNLPAIGIAQTRRLIGHGIANLVRQAMELRGLEWTPETGADAVKDFNAIYSQRLTLGTTIYPDVVSVLQGLKDKGWVMAVCTNKTERYAKTILANLSLAPFFDIVAGPDTYGFGKPDPRHLLETFDGLVFDGPRLFVGDSEVDIETAKAAMVPVIALTHGYSKTPLETLFPDAICDGFSGIPGALADIVARQR